MSVFEISSRNQVDNQNGHFTEILRMFVGFWFVFWKDNGSRGWMHGCDDWDMLRRGDLVGGGLKVRFLLK